MAITKTRMTVDEYDRLTEDDPRWTELVDGEIVVNEPRFPHARFQADLIGELAVWRKQGRGRPRAAGPTEVRLTEHDSYGPDLVVVPADPALTDRETLAILPLICVEIRSPSTWRHDIGLKKAVYEAAGVPELWLVDGVAAEVIVFRRSSPASPVYDVSLELTRADTLGSPLLPGFALALGELFS